MTLKDPQGVELKLCIYTRQVTRSQSFCFSFCLLVSIANPIVFIMMLLAKDLIHSWFHMHITRLPSFG